jgi:hypothetical protein
MRPFLFDLAMAENGQGGLSYVANQRIVRRWRGHVNSIDQASLTSLLERFHDSDAVDFPSLRIFR